MAGIGHRGFMGRSKGCSDSDGQAFITAAGITDPTQQAAICQLVKDLKGVGSTIYNSNNWPHIYAAYPIIGGAANQHKINLVDPSIHELSFIDTVIHDSNGMKALDGYALCDFNMGSDLISAGFNGGAITFYSHEDVTESMCPFGILAGASFWLRLQKSPTTIGFVAYRNPSLGTEGTATDNSLSGVYSMTGTRNQSGGNYQQAWYNQNRLSNANVSNTNGNFTENLALLGRKMAALSGDIDELFTKYASSFVVHNHLGADQNATNEIQDLHFAIDKFETTIGRL